uniref:Photosystem II PsbX n=1 Tax=Ostreococcus sp. 'lucimarinus' TaxID=242159 RepID=A0A6U0CI81_9CHLO|mmetsp:Transcript_627/g.2582  ORF Transcript_627/g.2582 Transcript_627/m.2582 type:complete len:115 (+) Transcript_627:188-532(+)
MISLSAHSARLAPTNAFVARRSRQGAIRSGAQKASAPVRAVAKQSFERESVQHKLSAATTAALITSLSNPLVAEAAITPSLKNTLLSVVAGGVVLGAIAAAVIGVSSFDKVSRK